MARRKRKRPRGVVDTSVLVAGIAGFKSPEGGRRNASASFLREWLENDTFTWLLSEKILTEYKEVLGRLGVRRTLVGGIVNLLREESVIIEPSVSASLSPDPGDGPFCSCAEGGNAAFLVTLNPKHFPQSALHAKVIGPADSIPTTARTRAVAKRAPIR